MLELLEAKKVVEPAKGWRSASPHKDRIEMHICLRLSTKIKAEALITAAERLHPENISSRIRATISGRRIFLISKRAAMPRKMNVSSV